MTEANNDEVICPNCVTQFRAIPVNVQAELRRLEAERVKLAASNKELRRILDHMAHYMECTEAVFQHGRMYLDMTLMPSMAKEARAALAQHGGAA